MNGITGFADLLADPDLPVDERMHHVQVIRNSSDHLLSLVNDLLDLSRIEANRTEVDLVDVELKELVERVVEVGGSAAIEKGLVVELECDAELPKLARLDPTRVRQVLLNLFSNACKFTLEGRITLRVHPIGRGPTTIAFELIDTGIGISESQIEFVFDRFTQVDESVTRRFGGTGLGLAISRKFCRLMGGDLTVTSEPGTGSEFVATIPAEVETPKSDGPDSSQAPPAVDDDSSAGTVLVIDDDPAARDLMARSLRKESYRVELADGGNKGLDRARELRPDVITLDVMMPGMDGPATLEALRKIDSLSETPAVFLTAKVLPTEIERYKQLGALDVIAKPFDPMGLSDQVRAVWNDR